MSAKAGWYPDPGGGQGLFRYWDGKTWSAATSPNPKSPPPTQGVIEASPQQPTGAGQAGLGQGGYGTGGYGTGGYGTGGYTQGGFGGYGQQATAYANYQEIQKKKSPIGWWIGGAALVIAIIVVAVLAIRAIGGGDIGVTGQPSSGPASQNFCPPEKPETADPNAHPNDGREHGGPISYPELGAPWSPPEPDPRVPFGSDVWTQMVPVETNFQPGQSWVAAVLVGELQAGDGFFSPQQGSEIVVRCIVSGELYGNNPVQSDVKVNQATVVDGHEAWIVESQLSFDIKGLKTKGELLIVVIISAGARSGLYYATIPDTTPELVPVARDLIKELKVTE